MLKYIMSNNLYFISYILFYFIHLLNSLSINSNSYSQKQMALSCYAASKNKDVISEVLKSLCTKLKVEHKKSNTDRLHILEIASGTGEHLHCFASNINNLYYQPTELQLEMHSSINAWTSMITNDNKICSPISFDVNDKNYKSVIPSDFNDNNVDIMICINMIHISPIQCTYSLFELASKVLIRTNGYLLTYGPYSIDGFMVESNIAFDQSLKSRDPEWGIRDINDLKNIAIKNNMFLYEQIDIPSNNMCLIFKRNIEI